MNEFYLHESSYVDEGAKVGAGSKIWHFCHVMAGASIGERCILGQNVFIGSNVFIGDGVKIQNNVSVYEGVIVEAGAFLGPSMVFTNVINPRSHIERKDEYRTTHVGRGCTIGANATIICGVSLGAHSFVGAGAVVTADVPDYALVYGTPARIQGWVCQCGEVLDLPERGDGSAAVCRGCGDRYQITDNGLTRNGVRA